MRERMVAWAGDCRLSGEIDLDDGRLSDQVNERDLLTVFAVTLEALEDGHRLAMDELEVERRELHLIEVDGRRGDPIRRLRTVREPVVLEIGPFRVTGHLHRSPASQPLAALSRRQHFVPVTEARVDLAEGSQPAFRRDVLLVNRDWIRSTEPLAAIPVWPDEPVPIPMGGVDG